jgi:tight adherence protein C
MTVFISSIASASSLFLFALWYVRSKSQADTRIRSLGPQQRMVAEAQDPFSQRVAFPLVQGTVTRFMSLLPTSLVGRSRKWLVVAGDRVSAPQFFTVVLAASTLLPALYIVAISGTSTSYSVRTILPIPVLALAGLFVPMFLLRRSAQRRQKRIWRSMPSALDLLTTCVEAGLSLDFALQRVAERYEGPLSDELHRMLREIGLGKPRRQALSDMADRIDVPDITTFVNSIVQAETLGTSVGQVLRVQAAQMRQRRRQRAEQVARQAPVKMVFPLVFFLMPSLFIVTIGPVILSVMDAIGKN